MMTARISDKNNREEIERVFKLFDYNRTGSISLEDMRRVATELGEEISEEELQEIINNVKEKMEQVTQGAQATGQPPGSAGSGAGEPQSEHYGQE